MRYVLCTPTLLPTLDSLFYNLAHTVFLMTRSQSLLMFDSIWFKTSQQHLSPVVISPISIPTLSPFHHLEECLIFSWSNQRSGTDSETEGEDGVGVIGGPQPQDNGLGLAAGQPRDLAAPRYPGGPQAGHPGGVPSPQLTLAEFLQK